jgi:hypothetical protein
MRRYLTVIATLVALGLSTSAVAASSSDVTVAVLGIEPIELPQSLASPLTDALRQRAANTAGVRLVQGKDLVEVKMVFGCDGETPACMAQAGRALGTDKLLYGTVRKSGKVAVTVNLKLLDVKSASVEKFVNDTVPRRELLAGNVSPIAGRWFNQLVEIEAKPTLTVSSDPSGATVTVDGQGYGRTPLTLRDLGPGGHTVVLTMPGRQPATRSVELRPGGSHDVVVTLEPEAQVVTQTPPPVVAPPPPEPQPLITPTTPLPPPTGHPGRAAKIAAGALVGGALVTAAVAIYTWRTYVDLEGTAHDDLKNLAQTVPSDGDFFKSPGCSVPGTVRETTPGAINKYKSDCSSGSNYANATTGLWIATGALATAGIVSFVIGDRQAAHAKERKTATIIKQTLRVAPVFSTQGGGLTAAFEF